MLLAGAWNGLGHCHEAISKAVSKASPNAARSWQLGTSFMGWWCAAGMTGTKLYYRLHNTQQAQPSVA